MSSYKLLGHHGSTCSRTVIATLEEAGAKYELQTIDLSKGEHKAADFVAKQPFGQIPVLLDGDYSIFESRAIARYVAQKEKAEELYPTDLKQRGAVESWLSVNQSNSGPIIDIVGEFFFGPAFYGKTADESKRAALTEKLNGLLDILETRLSKSKFLAGDHFTLADLSFLPYTAYLLQIKGFETALDGHKHVKTWWDQISNRPSWKKATSHGFGY